MSMSETENNSEVFSESYHESDGLISEAESDYNPDREIGSIKKMKYRVITEDKRKTLIDLIEEKQFSIAKAAKRVGIKYSTAKTIYGVFQTEGRVTTKLRRGVGAEQQKKKRNIKQQAKEKKTKKLIKVKAVEIQNFETEGQRVKTRASQRIEAPAETEQKTSQKLGSKELANQSQEPALAKMIKTEEQVIRTQMPAVMRDPGLQSIKNIPIGMPAIGPSREQQMLLTQLNYLIASNRYSIPTPPPSIFHSSHLGLKKPIIEDLLRNTQPTILPNAFGAPNQFIPRNHWANPFTGNIFNPPLFSNYQRLSMGGLNLNS